MWEREWAILETSNRWRQSLNDVGVAKPCRKSGRRDTQAETIICEGCHNPPLVSKIQVLSDSSRKLQFCPKPPWVLVSSLITPILSFALCPEWKIVGVAFSSLCRVWWGFFSLSHARCRSFVCAHGNGCNRSLTGYLPAVEEEWISIPLIS